MEVPIDPALALRVHAQLAHQNLTTVKSFVDVVSDYLSCLRRAQELQVGPRPCAQRCAPGAPPS